MGPPVVLLISEITLGDSCFFENRNLVSNSYFKLNEVHQFAVNDIAITLKNIQLISFSLQRSYI